MSAQVGNVGGMLFGFLFKSESITYLDAFQYIGYAVIGVSLVVLATKFAVGNKIEAKDLQDEKAIKESKLQVV